MKYPSGQYTKLVNAIIEMSAHVENIKELHPSSLHFAVYRQFSSGQKHNALVLLKDGSISVQHAAEQLKLDIDKRLFALDDDFLLYPEGCNDNHVITAVKRALKSI